MPGKSQSSGPFLLLRVALEPAKLRGKFCLHDPLHHGNRIQRFEQILKRFDDPQIMVRIMGIGRYGERMLEGSFGDRLEKALASQRSV